MDPSLSTCEKEVIINQHQDSNKERSESLTSKDSGFNSSSKESDGSVEVDASKPIIPMSSDDTRPTYDASDIRQVKVHAQKSRNLGVPPELQTALRHLKAQQRETDARNHEGEMLVGFDFVAALLAHDLGGNLSIPNRNVSLYIPPGALPLDKRPHLVYMYIASPDITKPALSKEETWLTPIIECGPSGLKFRKKVFLTLPHSVCESHNSIRRGTWAFTVHQGMHSERDPLSIWQKQPEKPIKSSKADVFTLAVTHFTRFGVSGRSSADNEVEEAEPLQERLVTKWMRVAAFEEKVKENPNQRLIRVKLYNIEECKEYEGVKWTSAATANVDTSFPVNSSKASLKVTLLELPQQWVPIQQESNKTIPFDNVWSASTKQAADGSSVKFAVILSACSDQSLSKDDQMLKIRISQNDESHEMWVPILQSGPNETTLTKEQVIQEHEDRFLARQQYYNSSITNQYFLNDRRFRRLYVILEGMDILERGWKALAYELEYQGVLTIDAMENIARGEKRSPCVVLMNDFFQERVEKSTARNIDLKILEALQILSNALLEIDNHDAKDLVEEEIKERKIRVEEEDQEYDHDVCTMYARRLNEDANHSEEMKSKKLNIGSGASWSWWRRLSLRMPLFLRCCYGTSKETSSEPLLNERNATLYKNRADSGYGTHPEASMELTRR